MSESAEFTTRDVLDQLNQRMGRVEEDLRSTREEFIRRMDVGFASVRAEIREAVGGVREEMREAVGGVRDEVGSVRDEVRGAIGSAREEMREAVGGARGEMREAVGSVREEMRALSAKVDRNFRWSMGIVLASWMSVMTTILLK